MTKQTVLNMTAIALLLVSCNMCSTVLRLSVWSRYCWYKLHAAFRQNVLQMTELNQLALEKGEFPARTGMELLNHREMPPLPHQHRDAAKIITAVGWVPNQGSLFSLNLHRPLEKTQPHKSVLFPTF